MRQPLAAVSIAATLAASPAIAGSYVYSVLPGEPTAINDRGQVVGHLFTGGGYFWQSGVASPVALPTGTPRPPATALSSVNDSGVAVGSASKPGQVGFPILYRSRLGKTLRVVVSSPGLATPSSAQFTGINDGGVAVGIATNDQSHPAGIVYDHGNTTVVTQFAASELWGINNAGQAYGTFYDNGQDGWFSYAGGVAIVLTFPSSFQASRAVVNSISPSGDLAGYVPDSTNAFVGFIEHEGSYMIVRYPGAYYTAVAAATNAGVIGWAMVNHTNGTLFLLRSGVWHAFNPFGGIYPEIVATASNGDFIGRYLNVSSIWQYYAAICPPDQRPCTQ